MTAPATSNSESQPTFLAAGKASIICLVVAAIVSAGAFSVVSIDEGVSSWARSVDLPGDIRKLVDLSEAFAHGLGVTLILLSILLASKAKRPVIAVILLTSLSGVLGNVSKAAFIRIRPHSVGKIEVVSQEQYDALQASGELDNRQPEAVLSDFGDARQRSFPSGHTATAWGLAIGLAMLYPSGSAVFFLVALLASFQRVQSGAHFPSDVLAGAAIAWACAALLISQPWFNRLRKKAS